MKQEMMGWQWHQLDHVQIICTLLQTDNHARMSSLIFLQAGCSSWRPTICENAEGSTSTLMVDLILCHQCHSSPHM